MKKKLISEGKLDKFGKPNASTPSEWLHAVPFVGGFASILFLELMTCSSSISVTPSVVRGSKKEESAEKPEAPAEGVEEPTTEKKKKKKRAAVRLRLLS